MYFLWLAYAEALKPDPAGYFTVIGGGGTAWLRNMGSECIVDIPMKLHTDSSAAKGIIMRNGVGKVKHLEVKCLWVQERESAGDFICVKVPRLENCSDLLTHHYSENEARINLTRMGLELRRERQPHDDHCEGGEEI